MIRDYRPKGVEFFYVYKALAHPELHGYVTPYTLEERLKHVAEARERIPTQATWLCDGMSNAIKHAMGDAPNSEFVIDAEGRIVSRRAWSNPAALRRDLERLVGPVEPPTRVEDLDVRFTPPPKVAASGVVPRPKLPAPLLPLRLEPVIADGAPPFYVKLRAEAEPRLLHNGRGMLYLGFHLDPIYRVHWNNLVPPLSFSVEGPEGLAITPASGEGPKVEAPTDVDPREFLVEVAADAERPVGAGPLRLRVRYAACNEDEGWCRVVAQEYRIVLEPDRDGGRAMRGNRPDVRGRGAPPDPDRLIAATVIHVHVDERTLTTRDQDGRERLFLVAGDALLRRDRAPASLAELRSGDGVLIDVDPETVEEDRPTIRRMMARSDGTIPRPPRR